MRPMSFIITDIENALRRTCPDMLLSEIRERAFRSARGMAMSLEYLPDSIRLYFPDDSYIDFAIWFNRPTTAHKAPAQTTTLGENDFNCKDNKGGIQGHSQGDMFPLVIGLCGDNPAIFFASMTLVCKDQDDVNQAALAALPLVKADNARAFRQWAIDAQQLPGRRFIDRS